MTTTWTAAHRTAVIDPHEDFALWESRGFTDQTVRQSLRLAGGGEALRIHLSNRYGDQPLEIGGAHLALRTKGHGIDPATDTPLTFHGAPTLTLPAGHETTSDPVHLPVHAGDELTISLYLPGDTGLTTFSAIPYDTGHAAPGDQLSATTLDDPEEFTTGHLLTGVDVLAPQGTRIAVAFGDSWIEGAATTPGADHSFPAQLSRRLTRGWIVNQGISGNRLLTDQIGEHLLARIDHDVLAVPGVSHVLVHIGLNDLGMPGHLAYPEPAQLPTAADFTTGLTTLADRLHTAGLTVIATTIGPYRGTVYDGYDSDAGQAVRRQINTWLLGDDHPFDAVADLAAAVADPDHPDRIHDAYNSGDGLHVNDAGAKAIADAIDVTLLDL
ncbi:GDSL-type esterase/lipase family protein [Streptomyces sp. NBC_01275]|uniref:GDSL-type esterase/lipase family protein n=1 Tax=Streptomyces sp. NBC_01275 TaxID=2903807 RepID=UPI002254D644|nr:GDSL-type esterase/lipase family protein [Streptomyces sp. NBC_01275]MCX4761235.1 GDSL-type esterase/lipase family protein [Streptomyces sp. NBC_01275]